LVSGSVGLKDLLGPVTRVKKKEVSAATVNGPGRMRARIEVSWTGVSLNSRLESQKEDNEERFAPMKQPESNDL